MKVILCWLVLATASTPSWGQDKSSNADDFSGAKLPVVVTPTRMRQAIQDVPASVTVLSAAQLKQFGVRTIVEALRLVPGMHVTKASGSWYMVGYHGTNTRTPQRLNVLVDGISVYRPAYADTFWTQLPVALEDISRIEVTRGPNSASYGPNSMLAVVNIITKNPSGREGASVSAGAGTRGERLIHGVFATSFGATSLSASASREKDAGYDRIDVPGGGSDSTVANRLAVRSQTKLGSESLINLQAALVDGRNEYPFRSQFETNPDLQLRDYYLGAEWIRLLNDGHELRLKSSHSSHKVTQRWSACFPQLAFLPELFAMYSANPNYANTIAAGRVPSGGSAQDDALALQAIAAVRRLGPAALTPVCGGVNADREERRTDLELQQTLVVNPALRYVAGLGVRHQVADSQLYLGGKGSNTRYRLFGAAEYRVLDWVLLNAGAYAEYDEVAGWSVAPRLAVNGHVAPNQTLRLVVSKGIRSPDVLDQQALIRYDVAVNDASPPIRFFQNARSNGGLRPEEAISTEVGYLATVPSLGLVVDAKLFRERLTSLISNVIDVQVLAPSNNDSVTLTGVELQASANLSPAWTAFLNYTYLDNRDATTAMERSQWSRHSGSIGVAHRLGSGWSVAAAYYGYGGSSFGESRYGRVDLVVGKTWDRIEASLVLSALDRKSTTHIPKPTSLREGFYDDRTSVFGRIKVSF